MKAQAGIPLICQPILTHMAFLVGLQTNKAILAKDISPLDSAGFPGANGWIGSVRRRLPLRRVAGPVAGHMLF